jgi:hypothetical protein
LDSPIIKNPTLLQIYIWSLLKANHQPKWFSIKVGKGLKEVHCDVGQFITGRNRAKEELGMPGSTWYTNITKLKEYGLLDIDANSHYSLITVVNYGGAAPDAKPLEQQKKKKKSSKRTTKEQPKDTNNNVKNEKKKKNININSSFSFDLKKIKNVESYERDEEKELETIAFKEIKTIIRETLPKVASIPKQLSYEEFKSLYAKYEWQDIINKIEELEDWKDVKKQNSLHNILLIFLKNGKGVKPMPKGEKNFFFREEKWYADTDEVDQYIEKVKNLKVMKESKHSGSQNDMRYFIRQYIFWIKAFADERFPKFKKLSSLTLEEAIQLEDEEVLGFWGDEDYVEDLHYSTELKKCNTAYDLLCAHSNHLWGEE